MRKHRFAPSALIVAALALLAPSGCSAPGDAGNLNEEADEPPPTSADEAVEQRADTLVVARLEPPEGGDPAVGGTVLLLRDRDGAPVTLEVDAVGLPPGGHAWHIHQGACGASGEIQIPLSATAEMEGITGPLEVGDDGVAQTEVEIAELQSSTVGAQQQSLHIHEGGEAEPGPTIACATI